MKPSHISTNPGNLVKIGVVDSEITGETRWTTKTRNKNKK